MEIVEKETSPKGTNQSEGTGLSISKRRRLRKKAKAKKEAETADKLAKVPNKSKNSNTPSKVEHIEPAKPETMKTATIVAAPKAEKSREEIMAEREVKKVAKQAAKTKTKVIDKNVTEKPAAPSTVEIPQTKPAVLPPQKEVNSTPKEKSREEIMAEREAKKLAKKEGKPKAKPELVAPEVSELSAKMEATQISVEKKEKPVLSKAERRAIQEAQRAAKTVKTPGKVPVSAPVPVEVKKPRESPEKSKIEKKVIPKTNDCKIKLFSHLEYTSPDNSKFVNGQIHPVIIQLGEQYSKRIIVGSNARYVAFLNALKAVIHDYETPPKKEFARSLESTIRTAVDHLHKCRPLAVSVTNAYKHIKYLLTQLDTNEPESKLKENLCSHIDSYIGNQICKAAEAINKSVKIVDGDVILTFGCSSLITYILQHAQIERKVNFRVIVVDSRPFLEGQELLRRLVSYNIPCTYVLINAVGFIMPEVTKVLLGAHALLANGYVMARTGTAQVALVASNYNVPVLVCCETHKFSDRVQTDAIVYNELGNPDDLVISKNCKLSNWQSQHKLVPLNLNYDVTPPELVTTVVTEVSVLPCSSVPVILRLRPTEIGY